MFFTFEPSRIAYVRFRCARPPIFSTGQFQCRWHILIRRRSRCTPTRSRRITAHLTSGLGFPRVTWPREMMDQLRSLEPRNLRKELAAAYPRVGSDLTDGLFMASRDGVRFRRWDEAFLRPGPQSGDFASRWMYGDNYQSYGLFETKSATHGAPNEISMFFGEAYWREGESRLRRYTIRSDGFVSVNAPFAGGEIVTRPLAYRGEQLEINYSTSAAGSIRIEIQDTAGDPLPGFSLDDCPEIIGDAIEHVVRWKLGSNVRKLTGKPVRLRFVMKDADLYSFKFNSAESQ